MIGIYFSGTGNTKHCVDKFVKCLDKNNTTFSIETSNIDILIAKHETIIFGYPVYFSNVPKIVRDFIITHNKCFYNKKIFIIATMAFFSGDGTGCSARLFKKYGASVIGGLHLKMPDCIGDEKVLKKGDEKNKTIVMQADSKILSAAEKLKSNTPTQDGLSLLHHMTGFFGQRLWFYTKTTKYKNKPNVDVTKCTGCGGCIQSCPMKNLEISNNKVTSKGECTLCYRCFVACSSKALTILGKHVYEQYSCKNY